MCLNGNKDLKSVWRPHAVHKIGTHEATPVDGFVHILSNMSELRGAHFYYRSLEDSAKKTRDWGKPDPLAGALTVQSYWNSVYDASLWKYGPELLSQLNFLMRA